MPSTDYRALSLTEMERRIARFEERVGDALRAAPPSKDRVRRALRRQGAEYCPVRLKRLSFDAILQHGDALADLFCEQPDDVIAILPYEATIGYQAPDASVRISAVKALTQGMEWIDEWGTSWGHAAGGVGATPVACPLADWNQLDEYLATRLPNTSAHGRFDTARALLEPHRTSRYCVGLVHLALFERLHSLRGMERVFLDLSEHETEVRRLLDALVAYLLEVIRVWGAMGADAVFVTDDWGSQTALMISPTMWRALFKSYYREVVAEAHKLGMDFILHSCGNVTAIVEDLIEIGVDVLDPIQPGAMDAEEIGRRFGGRIAFAGAVDVQQLLVNGTPAQVRGEIRRIIETLGAPFGNALLIGPANVLTPDVPLANLRAMFEACHRT